MTNKIERPHQQKVFILHNAMGSVNLDLYLSHLSTEFSISVCFSFAISKMTIIKVP